MCDNTSAEFLKEVLCSIVTSVRIEKMDSQTGYSFFRERDNGSDRGTEEV